MVPPPSAFPHTKARTIYFHRMGEFERLIGAKSRPEPGWRTRGHGKKIDDGEEGAGGGGRVGRVWGFVRGRRLPIPRNLLLLIRET